MFRKENEALIQQGEIISDIVSNELENGKRISIPKKPSDELLYDPIDD